jgi:hypothetical protein
MTRPGLAVRQKSLASEPPISAAYWAVIDKALRWAWSVVCKKWPQEVTNGDEEAITRRLQDTLNEHHRLDHHRLAPGLASFETVDRGAKQVSHDGRRIEKAPDLVFRPPLHQRVRNRSHWGAFIECKIISAQHSTTHYCEDGVRRFTQGEYASRMSSSAMVAYVRNKKQPFQTLKSILATTSYCTKSHVPGSSPDLSYSIHSRSALNPACVAIRVSHLWLPVPGHLSSGRRASGAPPTARPR